MSFSTILSLEGGFWVGGADSLSASGFCFLESSEALESDMFNSENAKLVLKRLEDNYRDIGEINRRIGDRATIIVGATATGFGLITNMRNTVPGLFSSFLFFIAAVLLLACFGFGMLCLWPRNSSQPGSVDIKHLWKYYIEVLEDVTMAHTIDDLCDTIADRRENNEKMGLYFKLSLGVGGASLFFLSLSELLASV